MKLPRYKSDASNFLSDALNTISEAVETVANKNFSVGQGLLISSSETDVVIQLGNPTARTATATHPLKVTDQGGLFVRVKFGLIANKKATSAMTFTDDPIFTLAMTLSSTNYIYSTLGCEYNTGGGYWLPSSSPPTIARFSTTQSGTSTTALGLIAVVTTNATVITNITQVAIGHLHWWRSGNGSNYQDDFLSKV